MLRPYILGFRRNQAQPVNPLAPTLKIRAQAQIPARVIPLPHVSDYLYNLEVI